MFASRTNWNTDPNAISLELAEMRSRGRDFLDLTETNPTRCGFEIPGQEILQPLTDDRALTYAPLPRGLKESREAISAYYGRSGHPVDADRLFVVAGTSEAYGFLFKLLLEPGETVLVPSPSYPLLSFLADIHDVKLKPYPLHYDGRWWLDLAALRDSIDSSCRAIVSIHPNNPTGSYLDTEEMQGLRDLAGASDLALIVDEVFYDYAIVRNDPPRSVSSDDVLTFTLNGISKTLGLPQMKLSWIAINGPPVSVDEACERLEIIADTYLSVSTPIQLAACRWLSMESTLRNEILNRVGDNWEKLQEQTELDVLNVEGGWSAIVRIPRTCPEETFVLELLKEEGVLVDPGAFYGFASEGYVVLSLLPLSKVFQQGIQGLAARVEKSNAQ
jgi:aspartate/methionine/tyrosine aminotransferase